MSEANLREANLPGADLRHASLFVTNLGKASLKKAGLSRADCKKAILEKTDLSESNLYRADFRGADLKDAILRKANLTGAKFQYAKNWGKVDWKGAFFDPAYPPKWPRGFPDPKTIGNDKFAPFGLGGGLFGLPGDFTPPSRFVRMALFTQNYPQPADSARAIW